MQSLADLEPLERGRNASKQLARGSLVLLSFLYKDDNFPKSFEKLQKALKVLKKFVGRIFGISGVIILYM